MANHLTALRIFLFVFAIFLAAQGNVFAATQLPEDVTPCHELGSAPTCDPPTDPFRCDDSTAYRCANNECKKDGGATQQGTQYYECVTSFYPTTTQDTNGCEVWTCGSNTSHSSGPFYDNIKEYSKPGDYQICPASDNDWASTPPSYQCSGTCYPKPEIKALNDLSLSPQNVFEQNSSQVKLPVNIGVANSAEQKIASESCQVDSYHYEIADNSGTAVTSKTVQGDSSVSFIPDSCVLQPSSSYKATAQACLQGLCGEKSSALSFSTSNAPELKSPYDPDWEQKDLNAPAKIPVKLEWCQVPGANFFDYRIYKEKPLDIKENFVWEDMVPSSTTHYSDANENNSVNILQKGVLYFWKVASCSVADPTKCGTPSQVWSFTPSYTTLKTSELKSPKNGDAVNLQSVLAWNGDNFAHHYLVRITGPIKNSLESFVGFSPEEPRLPLNSLWNGRPVFDRLLLNASYQWQVKSCAKTECENAWSQEWKFKTTGAKPTGLKTKPLDIVSGTTAIPTTLDWNDMPGAASYVFEVAGTTGLATEKSEAAVDYPLLKSATLYPWKVKTCADKEGAICGDWSTGTFTTATLESPSISAPPSSQTGFDPSTAIAWSKVFGANFYSYSLAFLSPSAKETSDNCKTPFTAANSIAQENSATVKIPCLGNYSLSVKACVDKNCEESGKPATQTFAVEKLLAPIGGLVPCGRGNDNPSTPWDEREPCQIKHVFLLIKILLDFALWRLAPIFAGLYTALTGVLLYFSLGDALALAKIKSIWKAFGIGVLIIFFAWLFLNIVLGLLGFNVTFYGKWFEIKIP